jgi:hypothetical protein
MRTTSARSYGPAVKTSAALALGALALVTASTSAGYAGAKVTSGDIRNNTIASADIKNGTIRAADLNPELRRDTTIGKAYAYVTRTDGPGDTVVHTLDKKRTQGFARVYQAQDDSEPITGIFCLVPARGVDLSRSAIQLSTEYAYSAGVGIDAIWSVETYSCKPGEVEVHTVQWLGDDEPSPSDNVAFQVFAP